jgi:hypothetical protein
MARPPKNTELENQLFEGITFEKPNPKEEMPEDKPRERRFNSRAHQSRTSNERQALDYTMGSRFNVPQEITEGDPDHQYGFVPYMANGEQLQDVVDDAVERGWWPVSKSEHPTLAKRYLTDLFGTNRTDQCDYIRKGGQIMMKISKEIHQAENAKWKSIDKKNEEFRKSMVLFDESRRGPLRNF